jgi:hypothetical protein
MKGDALQMPSVRRPAVLIAGSRIARRSSTAVHRCTIFPTGPLVPISIDGLLVAGRCLSATHIAMSGFRVMVTVSSIGQAAGIAAAQAAATNRMPREIDVAAVQARLEVEPHNVQWSKHKEQ